MKIAFARSLVAFSIIVCAVTVAADNDADYSQRLAVLVNQYRASHGLPDLMVDTTIAGLADEHSAAMAQAGQLNHDEFPSRAGDPDLPGALKTSGGTTVRRRVSSMAGAPRLDTTPTCSIRGSIVWALEPSRTT